ncbi:hypothetical protein DDZ14_07470 [Maritimibacter sp. 55A14]|uniref:glycosyltransferase 87 family protein n=1 Tax=Maritimibacter sp. 55A14 TaxID=2174844 RepID=UPI000D613304|nr:glycosyltransferase 87 family protein [Maritimibacter sp. 55A14]PWE32921.1 hypothetical protein DDZ14_07470 [Maritimibacter sp. 55A14]
MIESVVKRSPALSRFAGYLAIALILAGSLAGIEMQRGLGFSFSAIYDAGQRVLAGATADLYNAAAPIGGETPLGRTTYPGTPLASLLFTPLAQFEPRLAMTLYKLAGTLCLWTGLVLLYRHMRQFAGASPAERSHFFATFFGAALMFQPLWAVYAVGGSNMSFVFLLCVVGLIGHMRGRFAVSAACLTIAGLLLAPLLLALLLPLALAGVRFRLIAGAMIAGFALLSVLLFGIDVHLSLVTRMVYEFRHLEMPYFSGNLFTWVEVMLLSREDYFTLHDTPLTVAAFALALRLAAVAGFAWLCLAFRRRADPAAWRHAVFLLAIMAQPILSVSVSGERLAILFLPLTLLLAGWRQLPPLARAAVVCTLVMSLAQNPLVVTWVVDRFGMESWGNLFAVAVMKGLPMILTALTFAVWARPIAEVYERRVGFRQIDMVPGKGPTKGKNA